MYGTLAKMLIAIGVLLVLIGVILLVFNKVGFLGKLPGDIHVQKKNLTFSFPVVTCIVVSILLSLFISAFFFWFKK
jgi:hypothetical protein